MKKSFCEVLLQFYPRISEYEDLHSTFVANCVFNSFFCYTAIMLNIITIHAIRKTSSLPKTLKTLLLSLAVSDVGVGLLVQPFYTSFLAKWMKQNNPGCRAFEVFDLITYFFSTASFFGVVAVSVDRFLAIHLHLRYQELVTHKRIVAVVILIWVLSAFFLLLTMWAPLEIRSIFVGVGIITGLLLTGMVYIRIYFAVRRHKDQIQALQFRQASQNVEMANFANLVKSVVGTFYVYLVFLVCYIPVSLCAASFLIYSRSIALKRLWSFSLTLVFLNSSLNPVIYCWKMRHIRHAILDILRNMSWYRNFSSHQQVAESLERRMTKL